MEENIIENYRNNNDDNEGRDLFIDNDDEIEDMRFSQDGTEFRMIINKGGPGGAPHYLDYDLINHTVEFERFSFRYEDKSVFRLQQKNGNANEY